MAILDSLMRREMRLPTDTQRILILGRTGSGKTVAAKWHLSHRRYDLMPWVVYDFKTDPSLASIPYARELALTEVPSGPGVFIVRPAPGEEDAVQAQMWEIWRRGSIGVYVDEGYMVGTNNKAFRALLTQGRSKRIPMIYLTQRPVWLDRFAVSEADYYQIFQLNHVGDRNKIAEFVPAGRANLDARLPEFHSWYYDVGADDVRVLRAVPADDIIDRTFERRLGELDKRAKAV